VYARVALNIFFYYACQGRYARRRPEDQG
jgi:hypothetical protein